MAESGRTKRKEAIPMTDEKTLEIIVDFFNAVESACVNGRRQIAEAMKVTEKDTVTVPEQTFNLLKFEPQKGEKLGEFETAEKKNNTEQNWNHAYNVLKQSNSTINARYHGEAYICSYWLFKDKIYRQKLK
jgi:hypothetical protein